MPKDTVEAEALDAEQTQEGASGAEQITDAKAETLAASDAPPEKEVPATWPEDWRQKLAGDDDKALKRLSRFQSPADIFKSYRALEQRMASGELKAPLPADATEEQIAEFRQANGIPEKPEGYLADTDGLVFGDEDKPRVDAFLGKMHERNAPPDVVRDALGWYHEERERALAEISKGDKEYRRASEDDLRAEWGGEYRENLNAMGMLFSNAPEGLDDEILGARGPSGKLLGDNPALLKWLVSMANEVNPAATVAPGSGMGQIDSVQSEIAKIVKVMREDRKAYDADPKMQERLRKLYEAEEKLQKRA